MSEPKPPAGMMERGIVAWNYVPVSFEAPVLSRPVAAYLSIEDLKSAEPAVVDRSGFALVAMIPLVGLFLPPMGENTNSVHMSNEHPNIGLKTDEIELILVDEISRARLFYDVLFEDTDADYSLSGSINLRRKVYGHTSGLGILMAGLIPMLIIPMGTLVDQLDAEIRIVETRTDFEVFSQSFSIETRDFVRLQNIDIESKNYGERLVPEFVSELLSAILAAELRPIDASR